MPKNINKKALDALAKQDWKNAQNLFFYNAKNNPSHKTYNNLGYFLITEGLLCANGKTRSALKLGTKYLIKASNIGHSLLNSYAIAKSIDYQLRSAKNNEKKALYAQAYDCFKSTLSTEYSNELQYNLLRFSYLLNPHNKEVILQVKRLVQTFACQESITLYLEILRSNSLINEGLECIKEYYDFLDEIELLMFYTKYGFFEKGYALCQSIYDLYDFDEFITSAIVECCISTNHTEDIRKYSNRVTELNTETRFSIKNKWYIKVFDTSEDGAYYRKEIINKYHSYPPFIDSCCYFGCSLHSTAW